MSTRSIVARTTGPEGHFAGRYVHADGYPTGVGAELWKQLHGHFRNDLEEMLRFLLDEHKAGWSALVNKDFSLKPGYTWERAYNKSKQFAVFSQLPDYKRPQCFCCGSRHEEEQLFTQDDLENTDCEWLYVFDAENNKLFIRDLNHKEDVAVIGLDGKEPDWSKVECGENFERCVHYAWHHKLVPKTCNLSTQTFLGKQAFDFHDAVAFVVNGKRFRNTGSGGDSDHLNRVNFQHYPNRNPFPRGCWIATVVAQNGRRLEIPVAKHTDKGFAPLPGIQFVYPPTKLIEHETLVSA